MLEMKRRQILLYIPIDLYGLRLAHGPGLGEGRRCRLSLPSLSCGATESHGPELCCGEGSRDSQSEDLFLYMSQLPASFGVALAFSVFLSRPPPSLSSSWSLLNPLPCLGFSLGDMGQPHPRAPEVEVADKPTCSWLGAWPLTCFTPDCGCDTSVLSTAHRAPSPPRTPPLTQGDPHIAPEISP